jgi:hypothetical protein
MEHHWIFLFQKYIVNFIYFNLYYYYELKKTIFTAVWMPYRNFKPDLCQTEW